MSLPWSRSAFSTALIFVAGILLLALPVFGSGLAAPGRQTEPAADYVLEQSWPLPAAPSAPVDLAMGPEGRRRDPRIGRDRHALIMSGAAILQALLRLWPTDRLSVADRGLREGLLYSQMSADGVLDKER